MTLAGQAHTVGEGGECGVREGHARGEGGGLGEGVEAGGCGASVARAEGGFRCFDVYLGANGDGEGEV